MVDIAEEKPKVGSEAPKRDDNMSTLPTATVGFRSMASKRYKGLQSPRSLSEEAYEAGHKDGYGDGYIDGYDDGRYNQLVGLISELEEWRDKPINDWFEYVVLADVVIYLRDRLEHDR